MRYKLKVLFVAALAALFVGCVAPSKIKPGSDVLVVQAETLAREATDSVDKFLDFVDRNRAVAGRDLLAADALLREKAPDYLRELRTATERYKATREGKDATTLQEKIALVQDLLSLAREYYTPKEPNASQSNPSQ